MYSVMPNGLFYLFLWAGLMEDVFGLFLFLFTVEIPILNANSVDPDQTPRSAASDLGLHCLPMSHLWATTHE